MPSDGRAGAAAYYDLSPHHPDDVPFYIAQFPRPDCRVLELGCGTGRVSIPLASHGASVHGLDNSTAMLERLQANIEKRGVDPGRLTHQVADITDFDLDRRFDVVIAPFRVVQNVEADEDVASMLRCIARHLEPDGRAILNAFCPNREPEGLRTLWADGGERLAWEVDDQGDRVACYDRRRGVQADPLVLYPQLVYRRFRDGRQIDESTLDIAMRCYYPDEFVALVENAGFTVVDKWGGYAGEEYGDGPELVVSFRTSRPA